MKNKELTDQIISGKYVNIYHLSEKSRNKIINNLSQYPENGNCVFYVGLMQYNETKAIPYYKKAMKLGNMGAMVTLGRYYSTIASKFFICV